MGSCQPLKSDRSRTGDLREHRARLGALLVANQYAIALPAKSEAPPAPGFSRKYLAIREPNHGRHAMCRNNEEAVVSRAGPHYGIQAVRSDEKIAARRGAIGKPGRDAGGIWSIPAQVRPQRMCSGRRCEQSRGRSMQNSTPLPNWRSTCGRRSGKTPVPAPHDTFFVHQLIESRASPSQVSEALLRRWPRLAPAGARDFGHILQLRCPSCAKRRGEPPMPPPMMMARMSKVECFRRL